MSGTWWRAGEGVLINEQLSRRAGLELGDTVALLPGGALPVAGVYSDYGNPSPQAIMGLESFRQPVSRRSRSLRFALRAAARPRWRRWRPSCGGSLPCPKAAVIDQAGIKAFSLRVFERTFAVTGALNALTLAVAALAMLASLLTLAERCACRSWRRSGRWG